LLFVDLLASLALSTMSRISRADERPCTAGEVSQSRGVTPSESQLWICLKNY